MSKASDLMIRALENEGVERIYGLPGEENLDFLESLRTSSIRFILTRHEQAAGFMAATEGRLTGKPGVCLSTLGPGAANLVNAAAFAQLGAMPMVLITGQKPITKSKQAGFQLFDVVDMMQPVTKSTKTIINANEIAYDIRNAFRLAEEERPGAVHLELPEDIAAEQVENQHLVTPNLSPPPQADPSTINQIRDRVAGASHPLILVGAGSNRKPVCDALRSFINNLQIPFFCTQMGKGVIDERHSLYMGTAALSEGDFVHQAIDHADLILNMGHDYVEKPPFIMKPGGMEVIHINYTSSYVDQLYFPQYELLGDMAANIEALGKSLDGMTNWNFNYYNELKDSFNREIAEHSDQVSSDGALSPQLIVDVTREQLPEDGILTLDNGMYKIWYARNYPAYHPNTLLLDNALATMGAGLPAAIAAKLLNPQKKVMAVCGDGGFMMNSQELETAVRLNLDLTILLLNDAGLGMIKWKQDDMDFGDFGLSFSNPDFIQYAASYGANGMKINNANELSSKLAECLNTSGVHLLQVPISYQNSNDTL